MTFSTIMLAALCQLAICSLAFGHYGVGVFLLITCGTIRGYLANMED